MTMKIVCYLFASLVCFFAVSFAATVSPPPSMESLDASNKDTLNRELRKALLEKLSQELKDAQRYMDSMQPQLKDCQAKVNASLGPCAQCVDNACQRKYHNCPSMTIRHQSPNGSPLSVSSFNNNGQTKITVCSFMNGLSKTCDTIMNPVGYMINSISQINDRMVIQLSKMSGDLGNAAMGSFVNGLSGVVSGFNTPMNRTAWTPQDQQAFQNSMQHMQSTLNNVMQNLHSNLGNLGSNIQKSVGHVTDGVHHVTSGITHGIGSMANFGRSMGNWGRNFASAMSNMFSGIFGHGRFIRAAPRTDCNFGFMDLVQVCGGLSSQCSSCQKVDRNNLMQKVCGVEIVNKVEAIEKSMKQLQQIFNEISTAQNIITKVEFNNNLLNPVNIGYGGVVVTAKIRGITTVLPFNKNLELRNLSGTAKAMAIQIWKEWAANMSNP